MKAYHPTHKCFDDALDLIADMVRAGNSEKDLEHIRLVHAICEPKDVAPFAHAWVEALHEDTVYTIVLDAGQRVCLTFTTTEYYRMFRPVDMTKYTLRQAYEENRLHNNFGPWLDKYRALCGPKGLAKEAELARGKVIESEAPVSSD